MKFSLRHHLPFATIILQREEKTTVIEGVLLDTGSASSIFRTDDMALLGIYPEPNDPLRRMIGIGGGEYVIEKQLSLLNIDGISLNHFTLQMGTVDYGYGIHAILGANFFIQARAVIDFAEQNVRYLFTAP